ncbi:type III secretion system needle filament subunit SctF [Erwiniaceae bacterium BAC15a-03b]|uniref:Type III secretion system needle filament subunit SctF n=1 Tax=Winslowiella arboricola TaxID=2978220 RepID=A0A9J6PLL9_9GAMM|nr:type III secretion system needle filament subunit SctF [Winslowiella arboricola]MCU5773752.1 type III secretion system needle filament subunit SctF [Winslowiella arboricola]MCU5777662.1 type III secretion system needle filament subunit SctF [Winslowiella arboricola]
MAFIGSNLWDGFLTDMSGKFDSRVVELNTELQAALLDLQGDSSDPTLLAKYQSLSADYQVYRQTQSSVVKSYKDVATAIIANFR